MNGKYDYKTLFPSLDIVSRYAFGVGFPVVVSDYAALHPHHRQAHPQRGDRLGTGT